MENNPCKRQLSHMVGGGRLAQGFLFYGDAGLGRKTLAHWFASLLLCDQPENGLPCGHCKSCHNMQKDCHPDFLQAEHSGKLGGFSVETVRQLCSSVAVPPNNGTRKVYLFGDCDQMDVRSQNILLENTGRTASICIFFIHRFGEGYFIIHHSLPYFIIWIGTLQFGRLSGSCDSTRCTKCGFASFSR